MSAQTQIDSGANEQKTHDLPDSEPLIDTNNKTDTNTENVPQASSRYQRLINYIKKNPRFFIIRLSVLLAGLALIAFAPPLGGAMMAGVGAAGFSLGAYTSISAAALALGAGVTTLVTAAINYCVFMLTSSHFQKPASSTNPSSSSSPQTSTVVAPEAVRVVTPPSRSHAEIVRAKEAKAKAAEETKEATKKAALATDHNQMGDRSPSENNGAEEKKSTEEETPAAQQADAQEKTDPALSPISAGEFSPLGPSSLFPNPSPESSHTGHIPDSDTKQHEAPLLPFAAEYFSSKVIQSHLQSGDTGDTILPSHHNVQMNQSSLEGQTVTSMLNAAKTELLSSGTPGPIENQDTLKLAILLESLHTIGTSELGISSVLEPAPRKISLDEASPPQTPKI